MATVQRAPSPIEPNALLKDLFEKKQSLRRIAGEVGSMATELRDVRSRMATQELQLEQEAARRQAAEAKAEAMERELEYVHKSLEEKNTQAISTATVAEQYLRELVDVRSRLGSYEETEDTKSTIAATSQWQYTTLVKELEMKNEALAEHEAYAKKLSQQLQDLQQESQLREGSQMHLKEEMERMEMDMKVAVAKIMTRKESELMGALEELDMNGAEQLVKHLNVKDEEIARQREELRLLSAHLKTKAKEVEAQMDKHRTADQDLRKRVVKLEFWLQEARMQARKLQRIAEKKERELKDLRAKLSSNATASKCTSGFWGSSKLKIFMSVSVVALFFFARR